jgi:hypothetical protein
MDRKASLSNLTVFSIPSSSAATLPLPLEGGAEACLPVGRGGGDVILVIAFVLDSKYQNHDRIVNEQINENFFR